jgi:hypothetical protein
MPNVFPSRHSPLALFALAAFFALPAPARSQTA